MPSTNNKNNAELFAQSQTQLESLLRRAVGLAAPPKSKRPKSKFSHKKSNKTKENQNESSDYISFRNPPDEANFALGKQIAMIYSSIYFQCCDDSNTENESVHSGEKSKLKSKWKEVGFGFIENTFCRNEVDDAFVSAFFNAFTMEMINQIKNFNSSIGATNGNITTVMDDVCYWWVAVITTCENRTTDKSTHNFLSSSIRGYLKFISETISIINTTATNSSSFASKVVSNHAAATTVSIHVEDYVQLIRIYYKLKHDTSRQFLVRELISTLFQRTATASYALTRTTIPTHDQFHLVTPLFSKIVMSIITTRKAAAATSTTSNQYNELVLLSFNEERNLSLLISGIFHEMSFLLASNHKSNSIIDNKEKVVVKAEKNLDTFWKVSLPWLVDLYCRKLPSLLQNDNANNVGYSNSVINDLDICCQLFDLITKATQETLEYAKEEENGREQIVFLHEKKSLIEEFVNHVLNQLHHKVTFSSSSSSSMVTIQLLLIRINNLLTISNQMGENCNLKIHVSNEALFHTIMTTLMLNDQNDITLQLEVLTTIISSHKNSHNGEGDDNDNSGKGYTPMLWASLYCIGHIFMSTSQSYMHKMYANTIVQTVARVLESQKRYNNVTDVGKSFDHSRQQDMFIVSTNMTQKMNLLNSLTKEIQTSASSSKLFSNTDQQCYMLLLGLSMLINVRFLELGNENDNFKHIYSFLDKLLEEFPHLGRRSLPVLKSLLQYLVYKRMGDEVQKLFAFLCNSVARDASCAHEVWTMISTMIDPSSASIRVQSMMLRLYPLLCNTNKRLYGRICQSLGTYVSHPNPELRVVTASTICELAKKDIIRDVSDVIGWLQSFLTDEESMIVYYAILTLHYLILASELDYVIVLQVLNKKLVKFDASITHILQLKDDNVIEALVKFLGNGEIEDDEDSSSESDEEEKHVKNIPPHTQMSITTLCSLALAFLPTTIENHSIEIGKMRILHEIYVSLSRYSIDSFDIDEDLICVEDEEDEDNRYLQLKRVIDAGSRLTLSCDYFSHNKRFKLTIKDLTTKLEQIEHQSPVSLRWIQQHQRK